ncbi:putative B3 domain-containing protein Os04g0347400 [Asparagus officinalis]|uniref:putative B3 domain-containing protein Os04g0347400 n=1 Tax=Asparagus officinalis TaxID=4686 RepID=UPI00098E48B5|nr:putative B3 domain-containing protein Os04g0347400 [Asparagus officinalis]
MEKKDGGLQNLHFFKPLLPGFSKKLVFPTAFVKQIVKAEKFKTKTATLISPNGGSWHVNVYMDYNSENCMYFTGDGWLRFIRAHKLREGYFLVFCYKGNALFKFRVYDLSACDITSYASIDAHDDNGNENVKVNTKSKNISKQRKMKEKIRVIEVADEDEFEEDDGDKEREITEKEEQEKKKVLEVRLKKEKGFCMLLDIRE